LANISALKLVWIVYEINIYCLLLTVVGVRFVIQASAWRDRAGATNKSRLGARFTRADATADQTQTGSYLGLR
jgi:hypothetical protein